MRLTCPNCGAQYEVPDDAIPKEGRDVECSACSQTWFFAHPGDPASAKDIPEPPQIEPEPEAEPDLTDNSESEDDDLSGDPLEAPARRELDPAVAEILRSEAEREQKLRDQERQARDDQPAKTTPARDETLPDVEKISATLDSNSASPEQNAETQASGGNGFVRGFSLVVVLVVLLMLVYSNAAAVSDAIPKATPTIDAFVTYVDQGRIWLNNTFGNAVSP